MTTTAQKKRERKDSVKTLKGFIVKTNKYKYKKRKSTTVYKML